MKKRMLPLLLAALLCLTGCGSFLEREWYDILILVGNHTEEGTIRLYCSQEGLDANEAASSACQEVEHDTPVGSYAVEYLQYTVDDSARNYSEIVVTIGYRRTEQQLNSSADGTAADVERLVRGVETASGGQGWTVTFYPSRDNVGLAEILLGS